MTFTTEILTKFKEGLTLDGRKVVFEDGKELSSHHLLLKSDPEEYTKEFLIDPLIELFKLKKIKELHFKGPKNELRKVDYYLENKIGIQILSEAKPLNADLFKKGPNGCVNQIKWIFRLAKVKENFDFGVATDGINWIFIDKNAVIVHKFNLKDDLKKIEEIFVGKKVISSEKIEEEISKKFYSWYNALLYGGQYKDHTNRKKSISTKDCLIENIQFVSDLEEREQIAQTMINRLIFIKFLQSKEIINFDILNYLEKLPENILNSKLKELFFHILNTEKLDRIDFDIKFQNIPYLNGSLFIQTKIEIRNPNYKIKAHILKEILKFLDSFKFIHAEDVSDKQQLDPQILGYIFEKAMTSKDRKGTGSYYTPRSITNYISTKTIYPLIINKVNKLLTSKGFKKTELIKDFEEIFILRETTLLEIFNKILLKIRICDNACGSGAFLLATANILIEIFERINYDLRLQNSEIALRKLILKNNLYGVDKNPKAVEIAKLRLWLWLASVYDPDKIKPLPNIDFNLRVGDSLIGYIDISKFKEHKITLDDYFRIDESLHYWLIKRDETVSKYKDTVGGNSFSLKNEIEKIDQKIKTIMNNNLIQEIKQKNKPIRDKIFDIKNPFHWGFEFYNIFNGEDKEDCGFDIIIGNPPYGNILTNVEKKFLESYQTKNANEIAANFVERTLNLLKKDGFIGFVIANSIAINQSTSPARELIRQYITESQMALFGTRPAKIFADAEIRVLIFLGQKDYPKKPGIIFTSEAIKFTQEQKRSILDNIFFESTEGLTLGEEKIGDGLDDISLPKIGLLIIRNILLHLKACSTTVVKDRINKKSYDESLEFRKTGGYWLNALEKMPYKSTKIEKVTFETSIEKNFCVLLINSSLFYLFWSTYSNLRDFPRKLLEKFPFPSLDILSKNKVTIEKLKDNLSKCLLNCFDPDRGRVGEFKTGLCKEIIDSIDNFIGPLYNLTKSEIEFVKKYDSHIRKV